MVWGLNPPPAQQTGASISTRKCQKCRASANSRSLALLARVILITKKLFKLQNKKCFYTPKKIPKHKLTIPILQSFAFEKASDILHSARQNGFPLVIIT